MKSKSNLCPKCEGSMNMSKTEKLERAGVVRVLKAFGPALPGIEMRLSCAEDLCYKCFKVELLPEIQKHLGAFMGQQLKEIEQKEKGTDAFEDIKR